MSRWQWVLVQSTLLTLWLIGLTVTGNLFWLASITISTVALWAALERALDRPVKCWLGHRWMAFRAYRKYERFVIAAGRFVTYQVRCYRCGRVRHG